MNTIEELEIIQTMFMCGMFIVLVIICAKK